MLTNCPKLLHLSLHTSSRISFAPFLPFLLLPSPPSLHASSFLLFLRSFLPLPANSYRASSAPLILLFPSIRSFPLFIPCLYTGMSLFPFRHHPHTAPSYIEYYPERVCTSFVSNSTSTRDGGKLVPPCISVRRPWTIAVYAAEVGSLPRSGQPDGPQVGTVVSVASALYRVC